MHRHLQFNVSQLLKETTGGVREFDIEAPLAGIEEDGIITDTPLVGHVKFLRVGPNILVTVSLDSTIKKDCGRCLKTFTTPVKIELEEEFYPVLDILTGKGIPEPPEADVANRIDEQHTLDLAEVVRQELILVSDGILYCTAECKGLCAQCGQDLNIESCDCQDNQIDARWAGLLEIKVE